MTDETKVIEPQFGPYAGRRMTVQAAEADQAISEGWARDPFGPAPDPDEPSKEVPAEEQAEMIKKATAAGKRWRGEEEPDKDKLGKKHEPEHQQRRDMQARPGADYETKDRAEKAPHTSGSAKTHR